MGGHVDNPSYRQVCSGTTGHVEVTRVNFDPAELSFHDLLEVFFTIHDPTTLNRQGNDIGNIARSFFTPLKSSAKRQRRRLQS